MTEWISVNDGLSKLMVKAIWYNEHEDTIVGTYTKLGWVFSYYSEVPTHGKPMPEPPDEEEAEDKQ